MKASTFLPFFTILSISASIAPCDSLFEWLFGEKDKTAPIEERRVVVATGLKFEVPTADDKFLELKDVLNNLSELNRCYHVVVYNLKKRCGDLTEEELGKVAVQLLNCQSAAEERTTYTCTNEMTLADCTREMDPTTWNSYHIISNRARSLCMATQQQQFRKLTEITVNQLVSAAHGQLEHLKYIQDSQEQLHSITTDTVRKLYESQNDLLGNQQNLRTSQDVVLNQIKSNMDELRNEKALIAVGNRELADLTENIKQKLDTTTEELLRQEKTQVMSHKKIITDLTNIQQKSQDALKKLDESSSYLSQNHKEMLSQYELMYDNMLRINSTVDHLLNTVQNMQKNLDDRINWFSHLLNVADDKLSMLTCGALHLAYFLCAALALSFLQSPTLSRVVLFMLVTLNAVMEINCAQSLDFAAISIFMVLVCLVNCLFNWWSKRFQWKSSMQSQQPPGSLPAPGSPVMDDNEDRNQAPDTTTDGFPNAPLSPVEMRQLTKTLGRLYNSLNETVSAGGDHSFSSPNNRSFQSPFQEPRPSTSAFCPVIREERVKPDSSTVDDVAKVRRYLATLEENSSVGGELDNSGHRHSTPNEHHRSTDRPPSRGSTTTNRSFCEGFTKAGVPCRLNKSRGSTHCYRHRDQDTSLTIGS